MQKNKVLISKRKYNLPQFLERKLYLINILTEKENAFLSLYSNVMLQSERGSSLLPHCLGLSPLTQTTPLPDHSNKEFIALCDRKYRDIN